MSSTAAASTTSSTSSPSSSVAVVTGATGYIAGHVIEQLLRKGYHVRGTVRSTKDSKAAQLLKDFPALRLYEADLGKPGSFDEAIAGSRFVFHVASPATLSAEDGQRDIVDPAVKGTTTVIEAALATSSVEIIVLTSSSATQIDPAAPAGKVYTEADWNNHWPVTEAPYLLSKVLAERKAWELVDAHNAQPGQRHPVRLVTILPTTVVGPPTGSRVDGYSVNVVVDLLNGNQLEKGVDVFNLPDVDVRDVAAAHIAAAERPAASGRYVLSNPQPVTRLDYIDLLRPIFPTREMPSKAMGPWFLQPHTFDNGRSIRELGIQYRPLSESLHDMVAKLVDLGLVKKE